MCMFCAAIPATLALGAAANGQHRAAEKKALAAGQPAPKRQAPTAPIVAGAVIVLVAASAIYHTQTAA